MKTIDIDDASRPLSEYARESHDEAIIVVKDGKPTAALVPIDDADTETVSLSLNPRFIELIEQSRKQQDESGGLSTDEIRRRLGL